MTDVRGALLQQIKDKAVVHGKVTLSSGLEADYYVDLRRATLHHRAAPLIGTLLRQLTADWDYQAVGGLTLGADPVATAMLHASGGALDAFVVRKNAKAHGLQRRGHSDTAGGLHSTLVTTISSVVVKSLTSDQP